MLAEAVSIDGGTLVILLVILLMFVALFVALIVLGFVWAVKAGHGSESALTGWIIVLILEGLLALQGLLSVVTGRTFAPLGLFLPAVIAGQAVVFVRSRGRRP